jgi:hypothetical protein
LKKELKPMKKIVFLVLLLTLSIALGSALGADVTGKWIGKTGDSTITLNLRVDGAKLLGTINNSLAPEDTPFKEGKITGDEVSFFVVRNINETTVRVLWKGKAASDEIRFSREIEGQANSGTDIVMKKVK